MDKIRVGVIGVGNMGRNHARAYRNLRDLCELVAVVDTNEALGREVSSELGVRFYEEHGQIFDQVDAVSVAVPTRYHLQIASEFLDHKIHCLVEKPMAITVDDALQLVELANSNGMVLAIGQVERFNPVVAELKKLLSGGNLGSIRMMISRRVGPLPNSDIPEGVIMDLAIHDLDMARYLLNRETSSVYCRSGAANGNSNNSVGIMVDFEGVLVTAHVSWEMATKSRTLTVFGSEGTAEVDYMLQRLTLCYPEGQTEFPVQQGPPLERELANFLRCVGGTEELLISPFDGLKTLGLAIDAEMSAVRNYNSSAIGPNQGEESNVDLAPALTSV